MATVPHHAPTTRYQKCEASLATRQSRSGLRRGLLVTSGGAMAASLILRIIGQKGFANLAAQLAPAALLLAVWQGVAGVAANKPRRTRQR